jgi:hypothetical protein
MAMVVATNVTMFFRTVLCVRSVLTVWVQDC